MKFSKNKITTLAVLCFTALTFTACSGDDDDKKSGASAGTGTGTATGTGTETLEEKKAKLKTRLQDGATITSLEVVGEHGKALSKYQLHHPMTIKMKLKAGDKTRTDMISVGLLEKHDKGASHDKIHTCMLDSWQATISKADADKDGNVLIEKEVIPSDKCLPSGKKEHTYNLWVSQNAAVDGIDDANSEGNVASGDYNTQFFNADMIDTDGKDRNKQCKGVDGKAGCIIDIVLTESTGIDVNLDDFKLESRVFHLPKTCAVSHGVPDFESTVGLSLHGKTSFDHKTEGQEPKDVFEGTAKVHYEICALKDGKCDGDYKAIHLSGHGDGKADDKTEDHHKVDTIYADMPHVFHHDAHIPEGSDLCKSMNEGNWKDHNVFKIRACADLGTKESGPCSDKAACADSHPDENNCKSQTVYRVNEEAGTGSSNSKRFDYSYSRKAGNSIVNVTLDFGTKNLLNLSGATTENWANFLWRGWVSKDIFKIWANAQAYVAIVGSGYDLGLVFWGTTYFSDSKQIPEVKYSKDFTKSKQLCYNYNYGIAGVGINVQMCGNGKAGINVNKVNITAKTGAAGAPFDKSTKIGDVDALVTPNASLGLSATASLNVAVAKAGVTGTLTLVSVNVPATATMQWGLIAKNNKPALVVKNTTNVDVDVSLLSGKATVWVKVVKPKWCSCGSWCPGYPCTTWKSVVNKNLFSFSAYNLKKNLYKSSSQIELQ